MTTKKQLLLALTLMPDESFGWIVAALARGTIFPDGLGGFKPESRKAIVAIKALANDYTGE